MGASESAPRKLTIPNENQFIKITDNLAERLLACQQTKPGESEDGKGKKGIACDQGSSDGASSEQVSNSENIPPDRLKYSGDALINYYYGPSVTSLRLLQAKEKELKESENYWMKRIQSLEEHHKEIKEIMECEYNKALKEINNQVPRPAPDAEFPCMEEKDKVFECYQKNPNQALLCALEVSKFADCVQNRRIGSLQDKQC